MGAIAVSICPERQRLISCTATTTSRKYRIGFETFHVGGSTRRVVQAASMLAKDRSKLLIPQSEHDAWLASTLKDGLAKTSVVIKQHSHCVFMCEAVTGYSIDDVAVQQVAGADKAKRDKARTPGTSLHDRVIKLEVQAMNNAAATFLQDATKCDNCAEAYEQFAAASAQPGVQAVMAASLWCALGEAMQQPAGAGAAPQQQHGYGAAAAGHGARDGDEGAGQKRRQQQQQEEEDEQEAGQQRKRKRREQEEAQRKRHRDWEAEQQQQQQRHWEEEAQRRKQKEKEAKQRQRRRERAAQADGDAWQWYEKSYEKMMDEMEEMMRQQDRESEAFFADLHRMYEGHFGAHFARGAQRQQEEQRAHRKDQQQQQDQGQQQRKRKDEEQHHQQQRKRQQQGAGAAGPAPAAAAGKGAAGSSKLAELSAAVPDVENLPVAELQSFLKKQAPVGAAIPNISSCSTESQKKVWDCRRLMACGDAMDAAASRSSSRQKQCALALLRLDGAGSSSNSSSSSREAFAKQRRSAYLQLALLVHPDKAPAELAAVKCIFDAAFKALGAANELLA